MPSTADILKQAIAERYNGRNTKPVSEDDALAKYREMLNMTMDATGFEEAKEMQKELLGKAVGEIEPFKTSPLLGQQQGFLNTQQQFLDDYRAGVDELFDPTGELAQSMASRYRTGARQQLSALGQNAALGGIPASQSGMLDVMQQATDRIAQIPVNNLLSGVQAAGAGSQLAAGGVVSAGQAFQSAMTPATMISQLYGNTTVGMPLLEPGINAIGQIGAGQGNYFPQISGQPWGYLNPVV